MGWFIDFVWRYCYGFVSFFRCLVFCRLSFRKVLSCWRCDILLIGWLLSATVFIPIYFSSADVLFPFMIFSLFVQMQCIEFEWWYLWCCFAVFVFLLPRDWPVHWHTLTCWMVHGIFDDLMLGLLNLCYVGQVFSIRLYTVICSATRIGWQLHQSIGWLIDRSVDVWLIGWSTDRSIDSFIDWLVVGWEAIVFHSFGLTHWLVFFQCLAPMNAVTLGSFCWSFVGL